ncbi:unnamed protein product [Spirodela intermedia]|uniref:C2 NT-type domain-containing protein n=1 Tax=Spirodela intermedia TaxID=51605 RepID=A0A7I8KXF6_SPIIN|nr:unnamed protein product [Spirodela intermedia]
MSRIPKWKFEKNKVKVVFRLQFHATHIPQTGWDKLFVSFIPDEIGKISAKTNKANVRNGTCKWADPIYETTRLLLQDTSAKKYDEKFYKLVVAMGTSRSSFLGEAYINLADYADALKPTSVVLPLQGCDFGTILHVSIQLLTSKTGFREFEQQRETREKGFHLISNPSQEHVRKLGDSAERTMDKVDNANARVRFRQVSKELYSLEEMDEPDEDFEESAAGVDGSSCTSDSMYAEKVDISSTHGSSTKITNDGGQINQTESRHESPHHLLVQSTNERAHGWSSDFSVDNSLSSLYDENIKMRECLEVAESSILVMSTEINSLQCLAGELGADTQRLTHQFTAELASGEALLEEVSVLKSECSKLKDEFEVLRHYKRMLHLNGRRVENLHNPVVFSGISPDNFHSIKEWADKPCYLEKRRCDSSDASFDGTENQRHFSPECQSQCLEVVTLLEKKLKILRSKMQVRYHENDVDCLSDFDGVDCVLQNLKQCIMLSSSDMNPVKGNTNATQVTGIKHLIPLQTLLDQELDNRKMMKERICELLTELEESKAEQEALTRKMNQKVLHYDALILELEQRNKQTLNELDNVRAEHSSSLSTVSAFRSQIEKMRHDMNEQFTKLSEDKWYLESVNKELEKRVMTSETVLKRIRCTYSTAVDRLQKDLELLSAQVLSMFETNENLAKQALAEVPKLYFDEHVEEHPEFMKSRLRNDSQPKFDKILDKSNDLDCHQEPCPFSNAADLGYKTGQSFDPASDYKDSLFTRMPIYAEQDIKDAGGVNGTDLREGKTRPGLITHMLIQGERNLVSHTEECTGKMENNEFQGYAPILKHKCDYEESNVVIPSVSKDQEAQLQVRGPYRLNEKLYLNMEEELHEVYTLNVDLEILVKVLQETLREKNYLVGDMKEKMDELSQQLDRSTKSEGLLTLKLQDAFDGIRVLREDVTKFSVKCEDLTVEKYILHENLQDVYDKNSSLAQKLVECERLINDLKIYESRYTQCAAENSVLENLLKEESLQKSCLESEIKYIVQDYSSLKIELDKKSSTSDDLGKTVDLLGERLRCICSNIESYGSQVYGPSFASVSIKQELENNDHLAVVSHLEELQMEAFEKILKLNEEMNKTKKEKDSLHVFLKDMGSELLLIKQKSESELEEITLKLDLSNSLVEKLRLELQDVRTELQTKAESEQKLVDRNRDLTSKLTIMEYKLQDADNETRDISKKLLEFDRIYEELERSRMDVVNCRGEKETLVLSLQSMKESTFQLENELSNLKEQLKCGSEELKTERVTKVKLEDTITNLTSQLNEKNEQILSLQEQNAELVHLRLQLSNYESEKSGLQNLLLHHEERRGNLDDEMFSLHDRVADLFRELSSLKEALRSKNDELLAERLFRGEMEGKIAHLTSQLNAKREQVLSLNEQNSELAHLRQQVINLESDKSAVEQQLLLCNDKCSKELDAQLSILHSQVMNLDTELCKTRERLGCACDELYSEREIRGNLEATISDLTSLLNEKQEQLLHFGDQKVELANLRQQLLNLESEKFVVDEFLLSSKERIGELDTEISVLYSQVADLDAKVRNSNKCLRFTENELHSERDSRLKLESAVSELTSLLNEKQEQLVSFEEIKAELTLLRQAMSDIKSENSELQKLLLRGDELCCQMRGENSLLNVQITDLETHVCVLHKLLLSANIEATFIGSQYQTNMQELFDKFRILEESNKELQKNHLDVVAELQNCMAIKDYCYKENERLLEDHKLLKSALELSEHSKYPLDSIHERTVKSEKVDGLKVDAPELGIDDYVKKNYFPKEIEPFKLLLDFEEEMEHLRSSKDEHEIAGIILMSKLYEQQEHITFLQESHSELINLQGQHKELMHRLSEQILKTEEFKNLSIRLKELKDKADAETNQIREKRNSEAPSGAVVESLRVAFIKDQCEIKVQELQSQLDISKKHGEDILMKLQNALDEVELRKKSEASHVKRNEELSIKVLELESEMQLVVANRREFVKAYDEIKAELECSIISTECCKEEKFKLEASLGECNENLKNLRVELELTKRQLDSLTATSENLGSHDADIVGSVGHKYGEDAVVSQRNGRQVSIRGYANPDAHFREKSSEEKESTRGGGPLLEDTEYMASVEEQKREQQDLRAGIDRLQQELERMKNENLESLLPADEQQPLDPSIRGLEKELLQLEKANQRLGMIFPSFQEFPGHGNALERVLALELELAEALQAKKKPEIVFQSSFLRQLGDEAAVLQSFRDINELIGDTLNVRGRHAAMESELKEMHCRYSQLSLQFAEMEGERQKLLMKLKNIRSPRKAQP